MRILSFLAEDFKRLQVVEIKPDGSLIAVQGKNAQGKTSVLDAIWAALGGKSALPGEPIRKGAESARIELALGDGQKVEYVVKRTFNRDREPQLVIEAPDGAHYAQPQTMLNALWNGLAIDPLEFTRMKPKDQAAELQKLVPDIDFEAIEAATRGDYDRRTAVNRDAKALQARLSALRVPGDPRQQRVDESALIAELEEAGKKAAAIEKERARRQDLMREVRTAQSDADRQLRENDDRRREIEELEERIALIKESIANTEEIARKLGQSAKARQDEIEGLPALELPPDTSAIKARIDTARKNNLDVDERERAIKAHDVMAAELKALNEQSAALTKKIDDRSAMKAKAVADANLPVEGLALGDGEVLFNGLPLAQASDAERLRVSVAIAAAMNPKLRVIRVRDGSLLDEDGMKLLGEFAEKHDLQIWCERVASNAATGIILEDGMLKAAKADAA